jgi:hypothetical protein
MYARAEQWWLAMFNRHWDETIKIEVMDGK